MMVERVRFRYVNSSQIHLKSLLATVSSSPADNFTTWAGLMVSCRMKMHVLRPL